MEINLKKVKIINVTLSIFVALVMAGIVMDFQFMGDRRDLSLPEGGEGQPATKKGQVSATSDFTENEVILSGGLLTAPGGRLIYMRDKPKKRVSRVPAVSNRRATAPNANLSLKGTIVSDEGRSLAIFEDKRTRSEEIISVGDEVFGSGRITLIDEDRVVLTVPGGGTHEYRMNFEANGAAQPNAVGNARMGRPGVGSGRGSGLVAKAKWADELKMMQDKQRMNGPGAVGRYNDVPYDDTDAAGDESEDEADMFEEDEYIDEASLLPGASESFIIPKPEGDAGHSVLASLNTARASVPVDVDWWDVYDVLGNGSVNALAYVSYNLNTTGEPVSGFMVRESREGFFSSLFGLVQGDVITKVNEISLDTVGAWQSATDGLWNAPGIRLSVIRDGVESHFEFEVK